MLRITQRFLLFFILLSCSAGCLFSQSLSWERHSGYFTYVLRLNNDLTKTYIQHPDSFPVLAHFECLVDSFPTDSIFKKELPAGNYLFLHAEETKIDCRLSLISTFHVELLPNTDGVVLQVLNAEGNIVSDARLMLDNAAIPYDAKKHWYALKKKAKSGRLWVEQGSSLQVFDLLKETSTRSYGRYRWNIFRRMWYRSKKIWYRLTNGEEERYSNTYSERIGYMDFNKPKYLPQDTVKGKAYIQKKNGKPMTGELWLEVISDDWEDNHKPIFSRRISPKSPGAYVFEFVPGDSAHIGRTYHVNIRDRKKKHCWQTGQFKYEDYQLNETEFSASLDKDNYLINDSVMFRLKGNDANGIPLMDGKYSICVTLNSLSSFYPDSIYVSDTLWAHQGLMENSPETRVLIPDAVFPKVNASYSATIIFTNSNFETHEKILDFKIDREQEVLRLEQKDTLLLAYASGTPAAGDTYFLTALHSGSGFDSLFHKQIVLPYSGPVTPLAAEYVLSCKHRETRLSLRTDFSGVMASSRRTCDSVFFAVENAKALNLHYTIYHNRKIVVMGEGSFLKWKLEDKSQDTWYLHGNYIWAGVPCEFSAEARIYDKNLQIHIQQPTLVSPGELTEVRIHVEDYKGIPAVGVNLTAGCISGQFEEQHVPIMPYLGKRKAAVPHQQVFELQSGGVIFTSSQVLSRIGRKRFHLDTLAFYKTVYPASGVCMQYDSLNYGGIHPYFWESNQHQPNLKYAHLRLTEAQFSPFVFADGKRLSVYTIHIDHDLVYYYNVSLKSPYSFAAKPGYHRVMLRLRNRTIQLDSVLFKAGMKLELVIDTLVPNTKVKMRDEPEVFSYNEQYEINRHMFYLIKMHDGKPCYVWQRDHILELPSSGTNYNRNEVIRLGPFTPGLDIHVARRDDFSNIFNFETGYTYETTRALVKMRDYHEPSSGQPLPTDIDASFEFGERVLEESDMLLNSPSEVYSPFIKSDYKSGHTAPGNGTVRFLDTNDSSLYAILMFQNSGDSLNNWIFPGSQREFFDLPPGKYRFCFVTESGYALNEMVNVKPDVIFCKRINKNPAQKLLPASDEYKALFKRDERFTGNMGYSFGNGNLKVRAKDMKGDPIPFATLKLLKNGLQVMVAFTDVNGMGEFKSLAEGTYVVQVSYLGYLNTESIQVHLGKNQTGSVELDMKESGAMLQEVMIRGNRDVQYEKSLSYSVQSMAGVSISELAMDQVQFTPPEVYYYEVGFKQTEGGWNYGSGPPGPGGFALIDPDSKTGGILSKDISAKSLRTKFADYAYWQPNLITNEKGDAYFTALFPDNITKWKAHAVGMDAHKRTGAGIAETKSYRKVTASLSVPRFLVQGDESSVQEKVLNYTSLSYPLKSKFLVDDHLLRSADTVLKDFLLGSDRITAMTLDSLHILYTISLDNGFTDGEKRSIPVYPRGVSEKNGAFLLLGNDTSLVFDSRKGPVHIYATSNPISILLRDIEWMKQYPYECNEQKASKVMALLVEKKIRMAKGEKFREEKTLLRLIGRLEESQLSDGSWGWWGGGGANPWMTVYVLRALQKAHEAGYTIKSLSQGFDYVRWLIPQLNKERNNQLFALSMMSECKQTMEYAELLKKINKDSLGPEARIRYEQVKQNTGFQPDFPYLLAKMKTTTMGNVYWSGRGEGWYDNTQSCTIAMYELLSKDSLQRQLCERLVGYFLESRRTDGAWRNTVETACLLDILSPALIRGVKDTPSPQFTILWPKGSKEVLRFPYSDTLTTASLQLHRNGNTPIYFTAWQQSFNTLPQKIEQHFKLTTSLRENEDTVSMLQPGHVCVLQVDVDVKEKADYLMLTIPIPAGCSYADNKSGNWIESHREEYKDHTSIFCEQLLPGHYTFKVALQPRYAGSYTLNPAQLESMYFPTVKGRCGMKRVVVK
jgi:hypothetical protein